MADLSAGRKLSRSGESISEDFMTTFGRYNARMLALGALVLTAASREQG